MEKFLIILGFLFSINIMASNTDRFSNLTDKDHVTVQFVQLPSIVFEFKLMRVEGEIRLSYEERHKNYIKAMNNVVYRLSNDIATIASNFSSLKKGNGIVFFSDKLDSDNNRLAINHDEGSIAFHFIKDKIPCFLLYRLEDKQEFYLYDRELSDDQNIKDLIKNTIQNFIKIFN